MIHNVPWPTKPSVMPFSPASHSAVVIVVLLFVTHASQAAVLGAFVLVSSAGMLFA